jgi:pimeloyl-ACP methyl ester carboxylesterase
MHDTIPILLVAGLGGSPRIYAPVTPAIWQFGPVMLANHIRDDSLDAIARQILAEAPPRFALAGHSMGGYIAFEMMRQAPDRIIKLALINSQARPDTPEATARRRDQIARAQAGEYHAVLDDLFPASCIRRGARTLRCIDWFTTWATISAPTRSSGSRLRSSAGPTRGRYWLSSGARPWS